ncbi:MAG: ABC transporter ATP-binding protein [Ruminococcaceae bacterium]|nr:ABC transporter ATP-binding protein [Oscillospiraceae bacterium]
MAQIKCENLSLGYESTEIVSGLSFQVNAGDYLCVVGENGSGKTTLMKAILGIHKQIKGEITFGDGIKRGDVGYLPQQTAVQRDFPASVEEIVLSGFQGKKKFSPFYTAEEKQTALENMHKMNVCSLRDRCYRELSGGQQQRVLLARALCAADKILLLDEPTSGLDPKVCSDMYALIKELNEKYGMTVIMISHDVEAALRYSTHILHMGKEAFFGTVEEYKKSDASKGFVCHHPKHF